MIQRLPIVVDVLPEYLPYIMDAMFLAGRRFKQTSDSREKTYEELYRDIEEEQKRTKKK